MKALVISSNMDEAESMSLWFQVRWPQATLYSAADGSDGIEVAEAEWPDIVIVDLDLPGMDSFDTLEKIRLFSDVPLMVLASGDEETKKTWALELGADAYIVKPLSRVEFLARVQALLRRARTTHLKKERLVCTWRTTWRPNLINLLADCLAN
jgi:DNA-binding response OmpR family regulator